MAYHFLEAGVLKGLCSGLAVQGADLRVGEQESIGVCEPVGPQGFP